jgi:hypothetical protein
VHIVFGHSIADLAEVSADMGEGSAVPEQAGGQRVPGLVRHPPPDVELVDPQPERAVEPVVA